MSLQRLLDVQFELTLANILAFNVNTLGSILVQAEQAGVSISPHSIIYTLIDSIKEKMSELLPPEKVTTILGEAFVQRLFQYTTKKKIQIISGCKIMSGKVMRNDPVKVWRLGNVVHEGSINTFKHVKKDIMEATKGLECGIALESYPEIQIGDTIQAVSYSEKKRYIE